MRPCMNLITQFEGCKLQAYQDTNGIWTIGYGHTGADVYEGLKIDQTGANQFLAKDVQTVEFQVDSYVTAPIGDNEMEALISLVYNIGCGRFRRSTLCKMLNQQQDKTACANEFMLFVHDGGGNVLPGLVKRRQAERDLYLS